MRLRASAALFFAFQLLAHLASGAARLVTPAPGQVNLGGLVTVGGTFTIRSPATVPREFDPKAFPRLRPIGGAQPGLAAVAGDVAHLFDPATGKLVASVSGTAIGALFAAPGQVDLLSEEGTDEQRTLVRRERSTGREIWRVPLGRGWTSRFIWVGSTGIPGVAMFIAHVPVDVLWRSSDECLTIVGLERSEKQKLLGNPRFGNRMLSLDWASGRVVSDERFAFHRDIGTSDFMLVSGDGRETPAAEGEGSFKIVDSSTGSAVASGRLASGDLPPDSDEVFPRQFAGGERRWDFRPLRVGNELWLCTREFHFLPLGNKWKFQDTWTRFDAQGKRIGRIEPPLRTAPECLLRNAGSSPWPKLFAQIPGEAPRRGFSADGVLVLRDDGTFSSRPLLLPTGDSPPFKSYAWFHDGEIVYFLHHGGLYRSAPGVASATLVVPPPADDKFWKIPLVRDGSAVLLGQKTATVVSFRDGAIKPRTGEGAQGVTFLRSVGEGLIRLNGGLSEAGLPPGFDRFEEGIASAGFGTTERHPARKASQEVRVLRIWGEDDTGDVLLVPGLLKGGQAILVGVEWPDNRVAFWLPIARLKGLPEDEEPPGGSPFPYVVFSRKTSEAGLAVLEDTNRVTLYTIRRPGPVEQPLTP